MDNHTTTRRKHAPSTRDSLNGFRVRPVSLGSSKKAMMGDAFRMALKRTSHVENLGIPRIGERPEGTLAGPPRAPAGLRLNLTGHRRNIAGVRVDSAEVPRDLAGLRSITAEAPGEAPVMWPCQLDRGYREALVFDTFAEAEAFLAWAFEDYNGVKPMRRLRRRTPREYHEEVVKSVN